MMRVIRCLCDGMDAAWTPSPTLLAANQKLLELRKQAQAARPFPQHTATPAAHPITPASSLVAQIVRQPDHLGWGSTAVTQAIRRALQRRDMPAPGARQLNRNRRRQSAPPANGAEEAAAPPQTPSELRHYPSLGVAALDRRQAPVYRVWLACRGLDGAGCGWLDEGGVRRALSGEGSALRLCGWRRLRQILQQGHGRFWTWDRAQGRLWLHGAARVAAALRVTRLSGRPVALPVAALTQGIGVFKAHLFAAWHSGRRRGNPITRKKQAQLTGVPMRTQRAYCAAAGVRRRSNIAIGPRYGKAVAEQTAWQRGTAVFTFVDGRGRLGSPGTRYVAWHLPASHAGPHTQLARGRVRKINRKLQDLVHQGSRGNGSEQIERLYYANGAQAGTAVNQQRRSDIYWPTGRQQGCQLWAAIRVE